MLDCNAKLISEMVIEIKEKNVNLIQHHVCYFFGVLNIKEKAAKQKLCMINITNV